MATPTLTPGDIDLDHVNEETRILADALIEALGEEKGLEATLCIIKRCGGQRWHITSRQTLEAAIGREKARRMFKEGASVNEVVFETPLSSYQARKVKREVNAEEKRYQL